MKSSDPAHSQLPDADAALAPPSVASTAPATSAAPRGYRLRTLLTYPFMALIVVPALLIAGTSLYTGLRAVDTLSERVITDVSTRIEQAAVHQLEEAAIALRSTVPSQQYISASTLAMYADLAEVERMLFDLSSGARTSSYFFYGSADGTFIGVDRGRIGGQAGATIREKSSPTAFRSIYNASGPGDRSRLVETETKGFNVLERPWFKAAVLAKQLTWTPVYVSFATRALVTTASKPLYSASGALSGVLAADVELSGLSQFMKSVTVSQTGVAFIVDDSGMLVASTTAGDPFRTTAKGQERIRATQSLDAVERIAAGWWEKARTRGGEGGRAAQVAEKIQDETGDALDVATRRVTGIDGVNWDVVVAIPRNDLTAPIVKSAVLMFAVTFAALAAALQLALWIVGRVTTDVDALVAAADRSSVNDGEFVEPKTTLWETSVLSRAFGDMLNRIRNSADTIRRQNNDLAALNSTLEERVDRRTMQLEQKNIDLTQQMIAREALEVQLREANEVVIEQSKRKARFTAMLSHELRTPLQAIIGQTELLRRAAVSDAGVATGTGATGDAAVLEASSRSLLSLIDNILSHTFLESGNVEMVIAPFDVRANLADAVTIACAAGRVAPERVSLRVAADVPQHLLSDGGVVRQTVLNLLANSFRHAPDANVVIDVDMVPLPFEVTLLSAFSNKTAKALRVRVSDDGPGVPPSLRAHLFDPVRAYGGQKTLAPRGLGLAISALLVRSLGGAIQYVERDGGGACFEFTAQVSAVADADVGAANSAPGFPPAPSTRASRCLLVDDNPINLRLVQEMLAVLGHDVETASTGEAAIAAFVDPNALAHSARFDVVFMDLNLPGVSGVEAIERIDHLCAMSGVKPPRFIMLSASEKTELPQDFSERLRVNYVSKPATITSLHRALSQQQAALEVSRSGSNHPTHRNMDFSTLDQLRAIERSGGRAFLQELVTSYMIDLERDVDRCLSLVDAGDVEQLKRSTHSCAGAADQVGAKSLSEFLRGLVNEAGASRSRDLRAEARQRIDETQNSLRDWLAANYLTN